MTLAYCIMLLSFRLLSFLVLNDCEYRNIVQLQGNIDRFQLTDKRFRKELLDDIDVSNDLLDQLKKKKVLLVRTIDDIKVTCYCLNN